MTVISFTDQDIAKYTTADIASLAERLDKEKVRLIPAFEKRSLATDANPAKPRRGCYTHLFLVVRLEIEQRSRKVQK